MQRAEVLAFAQEWRREATGGVTIDVPVGGPERARRARDAEGGAVDPRCGRRSRHARSCAPLQPRRSVAWPPPAQLSAAGGRGRPMRPMARRSRAGYDQNYNENRQYWNFGCATQRNLAAMVANPADLVQPRSETPPKRQRRSSASRSSGKGESHAAPIPTREGQDQRLGQMIKARTTSPSRS